MTVVLLFVLLFLLLWLVFYAALPLLEHALGKAAHWTAKFRYRDYLPVFIVLAIGGVAASLAGDAFLDLAERLHAQSSRLHTVDREVHEWARTAHTDGSTRFFTILTLIGTPAGLGLILLIVIIFLAIERRWRWIAYLVFTVGVGGLVNLQLKAFFARARPDLAEALRHASGYSFPSGHAMGATVTFAALSYLAFRAISRWRWRAAAVAFAVAMIAAIASSRIYLGVHWISDIGAGIAAGLIWFVTTTVAYEVFRRIRMIRSLRAKRSVPAVFLFLLFAASAEAQVTTVTTEPAAPTSLTPVTIVLSNPCGCPQYGSIIIRNGNTFDIAHATGCFSACLAAENRYDVGLLPPGTYTVRHFLEGNPATAAAIGSFVVHAAPVPALDARGLALLAVMLGAVAVVLLRRVA